MIREKEGFFVFFIKIIDIIIILTAFLSIDIFQSQQIRISYLIDQHLWFILTILSLWYLSLQFNDIYKSFRTRKIYKELVLAMQAGIYVFSIMNFLLFIIPNFFAITQHSLFIFVLTSTAFICIEKIILMIFFKLIRKNGYNYKHILIVGTGNRSEKFIKEILDHPEWGYKIIGILDKSKEKINENIYGIEIIDTLENISKIMLNKIVDEVIFIVPRSWLADLEGVIHECETLGVNVVLALDLFNLKIAKIQTKEFGGIPLLSLETTNIKEWEIFCKRLLDIIVSVIAIIILSPIFLIIPILIKLTSEGPVFFKQIRSGLNGRVFTLYKFRTMVKNAEVLKNEIMDLNEMDGPIFKIKNDPRITKTGKFLRVTSIDELPQLFNVLFGTMSLVGPRPPLPSEVEKYEHWQRRKLSMKPGITCIWQVEGRNNISFNDWMLLDLKYIDNWSLYLDFKILIKTIPAVLFGHGAR